MRKCLVAYSLILLLAGIENASAQSTDAVISQAVESIRNGQAGDAVEPLDDLFESDPAAYSDTHRSAAYWLGLAYLQEDFPDDAREVWNIGLRALDAAGLFDPRLSIAFIQTVSEKAWKDDLPYATDHYLATLARLGTLPSEDMRAFDPYLEALLLIAPSDIKNDIGIDPGKAANEIPWSAHMAETLITWWRSQDPAPATRNNELLEEHLQRVEHAANHYRPNGTFDDRGSVYIRLGEPSRKTSVDFERTSFRNKVVDRSLTLNLFDFPGNEFWFYEHLGDPAQYIFHNTSGEFRIGETAHLLPTQLRTGIGSSDRGKEKSRAALRTLEEIYRQLALFHQSYSNRYLDVAAFVGLIDDSESIAEAAAAFDTPGQAFDAEDMDASVDFGSFDVDRPDLYLQNTVSTAKAEDEMIAADRAEYVPDVHPGVFDDVDALPIHTRIARFLNPDGTTRTELYWAAPVGALSPGKSGTKKIEDEGYTAKDYMLIVSSVQKDAVFRERIVNHSRLTLPDVFDGKEISVPTQTVIAEGDTGLYHLAFQWDQHVIFQGERKDMIDVGPRLKARVLRKDSLHALNNDPAVFEMSDLKPLFLTEYIDISQPIPDISELPAAISPAPSIDIDTPLLLNFELYNLTFGPDDRTRYTVSYRIDRKAGGLRIRRNQRERTSFKASFEHSSRTAQEDLLLDLSDWQGKGRLEITVEVTDEVSKQSVNRTIEYEIR